MIYVIGCDVLCVMKIGFTAEVAEARMAALQTANPFPLRLVATCQGTVREERELHVHMHEHRIRGEWFWMDDASLDLLERCGAFSRDGTLRSPDGTMSMEAASEWLGFSPSRLRAWQENGDGPDVVLVAGTLRYRVEALRAWVASRPRYQSVDEWRADHDR